MDIDAHQRVVAGLELEAYTIQTPDFQISRQMAFPRRGVGERGERFTRDWSIGTEYNSKPFSTIREGFFLLKAGLRKYSQQHYRSMSKSRKGQALLLVGGWRDRFAGAHIHVSVAGRELEKAEARKLAWHLHDHIPLLIAIGANSPVWADEITHTASNRVNRASKIYFKPIERNELTQRSYDEMLWSKGRVRKPPTVEIRVMDSNIPEFVMAATCVVKALTLNWLDRGKAPNRINKAAYLRSRSDAAERGMRAHLCWNGEWVTVPTYLDRLIWTLRDQFEQMDVPDEIWTTFKLLKKRVNGAVLIEAAARAAHQEHAQTWQRRFAKRYVAAIDHLLSGNSLHDFAQRLHVDLPDLDGVWLGRKNLRLS